MACENKAHVHSNWRDAYARSCKYRRKACESTFAILAATPNLDKLIIAPAALVILATPCCRPALGFASLSLLRADYWRLSMVGRGLKAYMVRRVSPAIKSWSNGLSELGCCSLICRQDLDSELRTVPLVSPSKWRLWSAGRLCSASTVTPLIMNLQL